MRDVPAERSTFDRPCWLPWYGHGHGYGNELSSDAWSELVDVRQQHVDELLAALLDAGVAAWAAYRPSPREVRHRTPAPHRVWLDTWMHAGG